MKGIRFFFNYRSRGPSIEKASTDFMSIDTIQKVRNFHKKFSQYQPTPLRSLDGLANKLHINKIWVKDESYRFGLNAFKVLGGSYAIGFYLSLKLGIDLSELSFNDLNSN